MLTSFSGSDNMITTKHTKQICFVYKDRKENRYERNENENDKGNVLERELLFSHVL